MKKKLNDGWYVYSEKGKPMGGPYGTEAEANKRLQQMEYFKHMKKQAKAEHIFNKLADIAERLSIYQQHKNNAQKSEKPVQSSPKQPVNAQPKSILASQVMGQVMQDQMRQAQLKQVNQKPIVLANQAPITPAKILAQQHEIQAANEEMIKQQIKDQQLMAVVQQLMPKENIQDSENVQYIDPKIMQMLEQIYISLPPKKRIKLDQVLAYSMYQAPIRDYQGYFLDVNADKQQRPLGLLTNNVETV
jgi:hypothetical protein